MPFENGTWIPHDTIGGNATNFIELMQHAEAISGNLFGILTLAAVFMIFFAATSYRDSDTALATAAFITTVFSILLAAVDLVADFIPIAMIFITMGSVILLYRGGKNNV